MAHQEDQGVTVNAVAPFFIVRFPCNRTYEAVKDGWIKESRNLVKLRHPNISA